MSNASRETKCFSRSFACAGQMSPPVQRRTTSAVPVASSVSRTAWLWHTGQRCGNTKGSADAGRLSSTTLTICGMTSPARCTIDRVADADVLARDLVLVVQRRVGNDHATHRNRLELGHRRQRARAAHLDLDIAQDRCRLLGRKLVRDGPSRRARHEAEPLLQIEPVHLVDDTVDIVAERRAPLADARDRTRSAPASSRTRSSPD